MPHRGQSLIAQAREVNDYARRICAESQRLQAFPTSPEPTRQGAMAATRARLRTLNLHELRETYQETLTAIRSARSQRDLAVLQLARTLIRQEIRHRGASPHEALFLSGSDGLRKEQGDFV